MRLVVGVTNTEFDLGQDVDAGFIFRVDPTLPILALRDLRLFVKTAKDVVGRVAGVEIPEAEFGTAAGTGPGAIGEIDRRTIGEGIIDALGRALERALRSRQVRRQLQWPGIPAAPDRNLIRIGLVVGCALEAIGAARIGHRPTADQVGAVAERQIAELPAVERHRKQPVRDAIAEPLIQAVHIEVEVGRRPPLKRAIDRRTRAVAAAIEQTLDIGNSDGLTVVLRVGDIVRVRRFGVEVGKVAEADVEQRAELTVARTPAIADQQVAVRGGLARLARVRCIKAPRQLETLEIEWSARPDVDQPGKARLDEISRRRLVHLQRRNVRGREILKCHHPRFGGKDLAPVVGRGEIGKAADQHAVRLAAAPRDLQSGNARRGFGGIDVGQLANVFGDDRIDLLPAVLLEALRRLEGLADAGDDDRSLGIARVGGGGVGGWCRVGRGGGRWRGCLGERRRGNHQHEDGRRAQNRRFEAHDWDPF